MNTDLTIGAHRFNAGEHLRLRHLRLLEQIDVGGSLSFVARTFNLSPPAITKMLHELEAVFGQSLVQRGARGGQLTPRGRIALDRLRIALENFDAAVQEADAAMPTLRVGLLPMVAVDLLPKALNRLRDQDVQTHLVLYEATVSELLEALVLGRVDCVIGRVDADWLSQADPRRLVCTPLADEGLAIAAAPGHALARLKRVDLAQLQSQRWVLAHTGSMTRRQFDAMFLGKGLLPPRPSIESASFHTNVRLVAGSDLLTLAPASAVAAYERQRLVRRIQTDFSFTAGNLSFVTLSSKAELSVVRSFMNALVEATT